MAKRKKEKSKAPLLATIAIASLLLSVLYQLGVFSALFSKQNKMEVKGYKVVPEYVAKEKDVGYLLTTMSLDEIVEQIFIEEQIEAEKLEKRTGKKIKVRTKDEIRDSLKEWQSPISVASLSGTLSMFEYNGNLWSMYITLEDKRRSINSGTDSLGRANKTIATKKILSYLKSKEDIILNFVKKDDKDKAETETEDLTNSSGVLTGKARVFIKESNQRRRLIADSEITLACKKNLCTGTGLIKSGEVEEIKDSYFLNFKDKNEYSLKYKFNFKLTPKKS